MERLQPPAKIYRIKDGKLEVWRSWCESLQITYKAMALKTLEEEGVIFESFLIFKIKEDFYTLGLAITPDGTNPRPASGDVELNQKHTIIKKECLEPVGDGEFSYFLSRY